MLTLLLILATLICALQAVRAGQLLHAALWLAGASAGTSLVLYSLGATQAAVIELSVGAGLVFILFVFAISLAPAAPPAGRAVVPVPVAVIGVGLVLLLVGELAWPYLGTQAVVSGATLEAPLGVILWQERQLDVLVQMVLIFAGALTVVGLLAPEGKKSTAPAAAQRAELESAQPKPVSPIRRLPERMAPTAAAYTPVAAAPDLAPTQERVA